MSRRVRLLDVVQHTGVVIDEVFSTEQDIEIYKRAHLGPWSMRETMVVISSIDLDSDFQREYVNRRGLT